MQNLFTGKLNNMGRLLFLVAALCIAGSLFFPWWSMELMAPQYPEGLSMNVYANKIGGRIDILNNLNHYIGMKEIKAEDFPELTIIPKVVMAVAALAALTAVLRRNSLAVFTAVAAAVSGAVGLQRMYHWLNKFGTDLDPHAPIQIDPFVPPVIGTNSFANFTTFTNFDVGGFLIGIGILLMFISLWRFRQCDERSSSVSA
jgi:hypothetical protein